MKPQYIIFVVFLFFAQASFTQESWDLRRCVDYAIEHNLSIKNSQLIVDQNRIDLNESNGMRLPNLNLNVNGGLNLGRSIDPTSNSFETATSSFNSYSLISDATIYNFGRIKNSIKQGHYNIEASTYSLEQAKQDLALSVVSAYLDILFAKDNLSNAKTQLTTSQAQLSQLNKLIDVGNRPANDRLELEAQIAQDEQSIIQFENAQILGELRLKQIMQMDPSTDLIMVRPDMDTPEIEALDLDINSIYLETLQNQNSIKSFDYQLKSAALDQEIAKSQLYPSLGLRAQVGTNYSSLAKDFMLVESRNDNNVLIDGVPSILTTFPGRAETIGTTSYPDQLDNNLGAGLSLSLRVPIFNAQSNKSNIERAKLNYETIQNNLEIEKQNILSQIQQSVTDVRSAQKQMIASQKSVDALNAAYINTQKRYDLGSANSFELTSAKNSLENARVNLIRTKYDYIFKIKILDYYRGRPLHLNNN